MLGLQGVRRRSIITAWASFVREHYARKQVYFIYQYSMPLPLQVAFVAGSSGMWRIERITAVAGESLPPAERLAGVEGPEGQRPPEGSWVLWGTTRQYR